MTRPSNTVWASVALLSIIVPVGLLATFRLTGVIKEPPKPETVTVEAVSWNMSRPTGTLLIDMWVENFYKDLAASVNLRVHVAKYYENDPFYPAESNDYVKLWINADMNVTSGFVYSMIIGFSRTETDALLKIYEASDSRRLENLEETDTRLLGTDKREAHFDAYSFNQPKNSFLGITVAWVFLDRNNTEHEITVTLEATYYTGSAYQKVVIPMRLEALLI